MVTLYMGRGRPHTYPPGIVTKPRADGQDVRTVRSNNTKRLCAEPRRDARDV